MERFKFDQEIAIMANKNLLYEVVKAFTGPNIVLSYHKVDNTQMGYVFEELIRIGAEQSNEEAGEHFTPREVIRLMVNLLLAPEKDLAKSHGVKTIYDPAGCYPSRKITSSSSIPRPIPTCSAKI